MTSRKIKMAYKLQLARESDPLHFINVGGIQGLKESTRFCLYEGKQPSLKKRRYLVSETVSGGSTLRYVGRNYGEGALQTTPTECSYLVGVRNKKKGTLTLHKADMYSVKPTLEDSSVEDSLGEKEEPSFMQKVAMMTEAFGGERRRRAIAAAQRNKLDAETLDSTLVSAVTLAQENTQREGDNQPPTGSLLLPPCNRQAQRPEDVYCLEDIAPHSDLDALQHLALTTLEDSQQDLQEWRESGRHPAYVLNRLGQLSGATGENAVETVCQLLYLSTLMRLYLQNSKDLSKRDQIGNDSYGTTGKVAKSTNLSFPVFPCGVMESVFRILTLCKETLHPKPTPPQGLSSPCPDIPEHMPSGVKEGILSRFASQSQFDKQKRAMYNMSRQQKDKLLSYILVLLLFLEKFSLDYVSLAADLKITTTKIATHLRALGCTLSSTSRLKSPSVSPAKQLAVLSLPLNFPVARGKRPRK